MKDFETAFNNLHLRVRTHALNIDASDLNNLFAKRSRALELLEEKYPDEAQNLYAEYRRFEDARPPGMTYRETLNDKKLGSPIMKAAFKAFKILQRHIEPDGLTCDDFFS